MIIQMVHDPESAAQDDQDNRDCGEEYNEIPARLLFVPDIEKADRLHAELQDG
jgi:hypothetical protein